MPFGRSGSGGSGGSSLRAYGTWVETNSDDDSLSTFSEVSDFDVEYNVENITYDYDGNYFSFDVDIEAFNVNVEVNVNWEILNDTASQSWFMHGLFYSDDNGGSWDSYDGNRIMVSVPYNTRYNSHTIQLQSSHVSGRIYKLRRACNSTNLRISGYLPDRDTMTNGQSQTFDVPLTGYKMMINSI